MLTTLPPARHQMFATSLANGLLILKSFKVGDAVLGNRDLAERTGLSKATVSRLTYTLVELGFLKQEAQQRRYRLGSATLSAGYPLLASLTIRQVARPFMRMLADHAHGSVSLGMRDRCSMVYIETCRGHDVLASPPDIGSSRPLLTTAIGRAWLAGVDEAQRHQALQQMQSVDPGTWEQHHHAVQESQHDFQTIGACFSRGEWQQEVHAVGVPMRLIIDGEILVFNCSVPAVLLGQRKLAVDVAPRLVDMVRSVERAYQAQQASTR